ncbi:DUF1016 N-terminal domain-containing protein [Pelorhabdus rhamnosifermentans]|uniref:DUF1016 N-terminal domain-containing protein n=1 Tax=Pelorhabdus rhamnosifermentans TaxID=2772457 RepID=UPI001C06159D
MNLQIQRKLEFPTAKGHSVRNLKYMAKLAVAFPDILIVQEVLAQLPWYQNIAFLDQNKRLGHSYIVCEKNYRKWLVTKCLSNRE